MSPVGIIQLGRWHTLYTPVYFNRHLQVLAIRPTKNCFLQTQNKTVNITCKISVILHRA